VIKTIVVTTALLFLAGCQWRPTYDDMVQPFETHRQAFNEIAQLGCEIGAREHLRTATEDVTNQRLKALLQAIDAEAISHTKQNDQCTLGIQYYVVGFAGSGWVQEYQFNVQSPTPYEEIKHTPDAVRENKVATSFDMPLGNNWYFSFRYS